MIKVKKTIDIILISVAIAVVVIFADRIIPSRSLSAEEDTEGISIGETVKRDTGGEGSVTGLRTDMVIEDRLFRPFEDIFAAAAPISTAEDEVVLPENGSGSGTESREVAGESQEIERTADEAADVNMEEKGEETAGSSGEAAAQEEDVDYSNSEGFRIEIDLSRQRMTVFYNDEVLKEMVCSGGAPESPTPLGEYVTSQKIEYAWIDRFDVGAYYWIRFFEDYLIHSVPFDENGEMIIEEYEKLGNPASHGCVRLRVEEAKWLYDMLPLGVKVVIY